MVKNKHVQRAIEIAVKAHEGTARRDGDLYFSHVARVANNKKYIRSHLTKAAAYLHDVVEDTDWTFEELREQGIPDDVINVLTYVTHDKSTPYNDYIDNVCLNVDAMLVKLSDLEDNSDVETLGVITKKDYERFIQYEKAKMKIMSTLLAHHPDVFRRIEGVEPWD